MVERVPSGAMTTHMFPDFAASVDRCRAKTARSRWFLFQKKVRIRSSSLEGKPVDRDSTYGEGDPTEERDEEELLFCEGIVRNGASAADHKAIQVAGMTEGHDAAGVVKGIVLDAIDCQRYP